MAFRTYQTTKTESTSWRGTIYKSISASGGIKTQTGKYTIHTFTGNGSFVVTGSGTAEVLIVAGGGGGGSDMGGGGGAGGLIFRSTVTLASGSYPITVGGGGPGAASGVGQARGSNGINSTAFGFTALGGGGGASCHDRSSSPAGDGGSGGGASGGGTLPSGGSGGGGYGGGIRGLGTAGQGNDGSSGIYAWYPGGGGGAGAAGSVNPGKGGDGLQYSLTGVSYFWAGGGGGSGYSSSGGNGGNGGGGGGAVNSTTGGSGLNPGFPGGGGSPGSQTNTPGGNGGANTGGGGGGGSHYNSNNKGGNGGSGIVIIRYKSNNSIPIPNDWDNVVSNGLVLHLDALNPNSYAGSGSIWYDFGPNKYQATMSNLSSSNWVTIDGTKAFETNDTNNQGFRISNFAVPGTSRTYELWLKSKSFSLGWQSWFDDSGNERVLFGTSTNTVHVYPDLNFTANLQPNIWYHISYTMSGASTVAYLNGQQIGTGNYTSTLASGNITLYLLGDAGSEISSGYCPIMRVYNRPLSSSEILANYNAQKARFGL